MIIDIHTHIFPDDLAARAMEQLADIGEIPPYLDGTKAGLLESMADAGVDRCVVCPVSTKPSQVRKSNDWVAALDDPRLIPFGTLYPGMDDAPGEVRRAVAMGIKGFKLHPEYQDFSPTEDRLRPMLEEVAAAGVPILFHAGHDAGFDTLHAPPRVYAELNDRLPELTMILAHMGSFRMWDDVRHWLVGRSLYLDTAYVHIDTPYVWGNEVVGPDMTSEEFRELVRAHGSDKVVFGSDSPWAEQEEQIEGVRRSGLDEFEVRAILGGNAARLLGLQETR
jgi:uncharacterized protein